MIALVDWKKSVTASATTGTPSARNGVKKLDIVTETSNKIDVGKEARRVARERIGKVPGTRKIEDKRRKPAKHKKPLREDQ